MKRMIPALVFSLFLFGLACNSDRSETEHTLILPKLLERNAKIQNGKEWERIQNVYASNIHKIRKEQMQAEPYLRLAEVYIHEARVTGEHGHYYPAALEVLDLALAVPDLHRDERFLALSHKSSVMLSQHEFATALELAQEAVQLNTHSAQIYGALVDAYVELGDYDKAVEMADQMIKVRPDLRSYSRVSYLREIHGDLDGAIRAMQMAVDAGFPGEEQSAWARLTLGSLYEKTGKSGMAEEQYKLLLQERENYPFAVAALANLAYEAGDLNKAEQLLNEAIAIIPEVGFYEQLAFIYKDQNRTEELDAIVADIFLMLEDDVKSGHNMNLEYAQLHLELLETYDDALSYAADEYRKRPANIDVNRMMALIYEKQNHMQKARQHAEVAHNTGAFFPELQQITSASISYKNQ